MKLHPTQIVGLVAIVGFGGVFINTLLKPKRDPMILPNGFDMRTLPSPADVLSPPVQPVPPADLLAAGSQDARDDLYCSGAIFAVRNDPDGALSPEAQRRRDMTIALAESGVAKLLAENAATETMTGAIADTHAEAAVEDHAADTLRISVGDCMTRAEALSASGAN